MKNLQGLINILQDGSLNYDQSYLAFSLIADGKSNDDEIKNFLTLINKKGIDENLLCGAAKSLDERSIKIKAPKDCVDVCGTGGDGSNSLNISTTISIILASMGIKIAKHGNKAVSSKSGSADVFDKLGININLEKEEIEKNLEDNNFAFIFAPLYHPALKNVAKARKELGVRTIFNFLGPLINPAQTQYQLIGCSDKKIAKLMLKAFYFLKKKRCFVVTGLDGMDEISISSDSLIQKIDDNGNITEEIFNPEDYGIKKSHINLIKGGDAKYNAQKLVELLKGNIKDEKMQAYLDIVSVNCAYCLILLNKFDNTQQAINFSKDYIRSGKAYQFYQDQLLSCQ